MTGELRTSKLSPKNYYELCTGTCPVVVFSALTCVRACVCVCVCVCVYIYIYMCVCVCVCVCV
jgi:hypothetical protein